MLCQDKMVDVYEWVIHAHFITLLLENVSLVFKVHPFQMGNVLWQLRFQLLLQHPFRNHNLFLNLNQSHSQFLNLNQFLNLSLFLNHNQFLMLHATGDKWKSTMFVWKWAAFAENGTAEHSALLAMVDMPLMRVSVASLPPLLSPVTGDKSELEVYVSKSVTNVPLSITPLPFVFLVTGDTL